MKSLRISQAMHADLEALSSRYDFSVREIANRAIRRGHRKNTVVFASDHKATTYKGPILKVEMLGYSQKICRAFIEIYVKEHIGLPAPEVFKPEATAGVDYIME